MTTQSTSRTNCRFILMNTFSSSKHQEIVKLDEVASSSATIYYDCNHQTGLSGPSDGNFDSGKHTSSRINVVDSARKKYISWRYKRNDLDTISFTRDQTNSRRSQRKRAFQGKVNGTLMLQETDAGSPDQLNENSSGSEYKPKESSYSSSDSLSDVSTVIPDTSELHTESLTRTTTLSLGKQQMEKQQIDEMKINHYQDSLQCQTTGFQADNSQYSNVSLEEKDQVVIPKTNNEISRIYDKKFFCLFCGQPKTKMKDHLLSKQHQGESELMKLRALRDVDKTEEAKYFEKLRNLGNHLHNCEVLNSGKGILAVRYRPRDKANVDDYGPCPYCYGYYVRKELWRHKCQHKPSEETHHKRGCLAASSLFLLPGTTQTSKLLQKVISNMRSDDISRIAKSDLIIIAFGEKLCSKHGHDHDQHNYIRQKMREMARLLKEMRQHQNNPEMRFIDFIDPRFFRTIVECSKQICSFDDTSNRYRTPSLALKIGHSLQKCAKIVIGRGIETGQRDLQTKAEELLKLLEMNWTEEVSSNALKSLNEEKRNKSSSIIPLTEDVKLLGEYLRSEADVVYKTLIDAVEIERVKASWISLSEISLAQTILFNRRRSGEVSKMKLTDYTGRHQVDLDGPMSNYLTALEKQLCQTLYRVEVDGKRGRTVPVLFPSTVKRNIDLLNSKRILMVGQENQFLFPRVFFGSVTHIRGTDCLRKFANDCGAKAPERLRSTKLRKHIATMSQIINLKDHELDILANFLGHDIRVHRDFYRLPEATVQIAKISKLLLSKERGGDAISMGQSLDDISLEYEEELQDDTIGSDRDSESDEAVSMDEAEDNAADDTVPGGDVLEKKRKLQKRAWTTEEKNAVLMHLNKYILLRQLPGKKAIDNCIVAEPVLAGRTWRNVKDFCRNRITALKKA